MSANPQAANTASLSEMRTANLAPAIVPTGPDQIVNLFSERGFQLAQRIGKAFATSDAVPMQFRHQIPKKERGGGVVMVDNPAAIGNCLVAIETAQAVGMSITAVMQQANVIEGRLTWSGKFVIAAINASGRFTPLRFDLVNKGVIKAKYREKQGWNKEKGGFDFKDIEVQLENLECVAWALPGNMAFPPNVRTLAEAKASNLPVIESAPVSMKLAVEEGWYGKSGSKWQTEMKHLMLQYRAGSFFGNIHAPDIVMGMGRTSEELADVIDITPDNAIAIDELRRQPVRAANNVTDVVQKNSTENTEQPATEGGEPAATSEADTTPKFDIAAFAEKLEACKTADALAQLFDTVRTTTANEEEKAVLLDVFERKNKTFEDGAQKPAADATPAATAPATSRRTRSASPSID